MDTTSEPTTDNNKSAPLTAALADAEDKVRNRARELYSTGHDKAVELKDRAADATTALSNRASNVGEALIETIKEHPLKSVAAAFGVGYLVMRLRR